MLLDQLGDQVLAKEMFGEYGFCRDGTFFGVACDDQLFIKLTAVGRTLCDGAASKIDEASPYPGARPALRILDEA